MASARVRGFPLGYDSNTNSPRNQRATALNGGEKRSRALDGGHRRSMTFAGSKDRGNEKKAEARGFGPGSRFSAWVRFKHKLALKSTGDGAQRRREAVAGVRRRAFTFDGVHGIGKSGIRNFSRKPSASFPFPRVYAGFPRRRPDAGRSVRRNAPPRSRDEWRSRTWT